jgi:hypothetical protein
MKKNIAISTIEAINLAIEIQGLLEPVGYNVALTGSCLYSGGSFDDIDLVVYPHKVDALYIKDSCVVELKRHFPGLELRDHSKYLDNKTVYKTVYRGITIDFFVLS